MATQALIIIGVFVVCLFLGFPIYAPAPKNERSASRKPPAGSYFSFILAFFSREINAFCACASFSGNGTRNRPRPLAFSVFL